MRTYTDDKKLSAQEQYNLDTYGALSPQEFAPDEEEQLEPGQCVCGAFDCKTEYACYTSGY